MSIAFAGDASRVGTAAGTQVLVPVGARDLAMNGADIANSGGLAATYWNPAGLTKVSGGAGLVSNMSYFNDIGVNHLGAGFGFGQGTVAFSVKTIDFGDVLVTTRDNMDGTDNYFSPTFATVGLTYARSLIDRAQVGITAKVVYESLPRASAAAVVFDAGVQYQNIADINGLNLGLVIKNIGQNLQYEGSALLGQATDDGASYRDYRSIVASEDQLPSVYEVGLSYTMPLGLTLASTYSSHNFDYDELRLGGEFALGGMLFLRGGTTMVQAGDDEVNDEDVLYSTTFGGGIKYNLFGLNTTIDVTYRTQQYFDGNMMWSIGVDF